MQNFGTLGQLFKIPPCPPKNVRVWGGKGGRIFFELGAHVKCPNPMTTPSGILVTEVRRRRSGRLIRGQPRLLRWSHALHSDQNVSLVISSNTPHWPVAAEL